MKKQFVTYEIALKLKELGFDEDCFGYYTPMKHWMISTNPKYNTVPHFIGPNWCTEDMKMRFMYVVNSFGDRNSTIKNSGFTKAIHNIAAPLWQQVIAWFKEKHNIYIDIYTIKDFSSPYYSFNIFTKDNVIKLTNFKIGSNINYYYIREQAILKAIELIKNK